MTLLETYKDSVNYPAMEQLHIKTNGVISVIDQIQARMVEESQGKPGLPALQSAQTGTTQIQYKFISNPFNPNPFNDFLLPGCSTRNELDETLLGYKASLSELVLKTDKGKYMKLLDPSLFLSDNEKDGEISLLSGLHSLELLKNSILMVESCMLTSIAKNN
jgi:hypothetical protein